MARSVVFHGRTIVHPGAEVYVDLTGMVRPNVTSARIGAVVAEAPQGEGGVVHVFADADSAKQYFGESDAANAAQLFFDPSNDERVDGGVEILYIYNPKRTTQAERWLVRDLEGGPVPENTTTGSAILATELNRVVSAGQRVGSTPAYVDIPNTTPTAYATNVFQNLVVDIISGWGKGQQKQISASAEHPTDNTKYRLYLREDLEWEVLPFESGYDTRLRIAAPQHRLLSTEYGPVGNFNSVEFGPASANRAFVLNAKYRNRTETLPAPFGGDLAKTISLKFDPTGDNGLNSFLDPLTWIAPPVTGGSGTSTVAATNTVLDGGAGLVADVQAGRWVVVTAVNPLQPLQSPLLGKVFKVKANTATSITLHGTGLGTTLTAGALDGIVWRVISLESAYMETLGENGQSKTLNLYIKDLALAPVLYASVDLTRFKTLDALIQKLNTLRGVQATLGDGVDSTLSTSRFDFAQAAEHQGRHKIGMLNAGVVNGATSLVLSVSGSREGTSHLPTSGFPYFVVVGENTAQPTIAKVTANNGTTTLTIDPLSGAPTGGYLAEDVVALVPNDEVAYRLGSQLIVGPLDTTNEGDVLRDNNTKLLQSVAQTFGRFTAERAIGAGSSAYASQIGAGVGENNKDIFALFYNGDEGTSVVEPDEEAPLYPISWSHGLDELLKIRDIQVIVPCVSDDLDSWSAGDIERFMVLFSNHLKDCDDARAERIGFFGLDFPLEEGTYQGQTFTRGLLDWSRFFNQESLALVGQRAVVNDATGRLVEMPPWAFALLCAGTHLGIETGEALTFKFVRVSELTTRFNDWDVRDTLDIRKCLFGGLLVGEPEGGRIRIVRGLTTHVATDNLARTDINVWNIRNKIRREMRELLEGRFAGRRVGADTQGVRKRAPASPASIREAVTNYLAEQRAEGVITDSEDEQGRIINAWRGLRVSITGDVGRVAVQVFPSSALNFLLVDIGFQLPTLRG